jgi:predicted RNase H-like nuclease (RuvC/YqgF family)
MTPPKLSYPDTTSPGHSNKPKHKKLLKSLKDILKNTIK